MICLVNIPHHAKAFFVKEQPAETHLVSPSLTSRRGGPTAFEVKFVIDEPTAQEIERWSRQHLEVDPFCLKQPDGTYCITSLYTDTPAFDVYHRAPLYRRRKFRLRRYGSEGTIHLERKARRGERVSKHRTSVHQSELVFLGEPEARSDWQGAWFHERLLRKSLQPACVLVYKRAAYLASSSEGPLRLTIDRQIQGQLSSRWHVGLTAEPQSILPGQAILELKFREAMPSLYKQLVADLQLTASGFSKYRRCLDTCGLPLPTVVTKE